MTPKQVMAILQDQLAFADKENVALKAANAELVKTLKFVLTGLEKGSVKAQPIMDFSDENAESLQMMSLTTVIHAALTKAGVA